MKELTTKQLCICGIFIAAAAVTHYLESLLPPLVIGMPIKLGLANIFTVLTLCAYPRKKQLGFIVTILRCILGALMSGSVMGMMFSVCGGSLSFSAMALLFFLFEKNKITLIGLSVIGAFFFNVGQLLVGAITYGSGMLLYFPMLSLFSVPTGLLIGLISEMSKKTVIRFSKT